MTLFFLLIILPSPSAWHLLLWLLGANMMAISCVTKYETFYTAHSTSAQWLGIKRWEIFRLPGPGSDDELSWVRPEREASQLAVPGNVGNYTSRAARGAGHRDPGDISPPGLRDKRK